MNKTCSATNNSLYKIHLDIHFGSNGTMRSEFDLLKNAGDTKSNGINWNVMIWFSKTYENNLYQMVSVSHAKSFQYQFCIIKTNDFHKLLNALNDRLYEYFQISYLP